MELVEPVEKINYYLERDYGKLGDRVIWRIVWSDDQLEKRKGEFHYNDDSGNHLKTEVGIMEVPKYSYIVGKWILERIMPVPEINRDQLVTPLSYEPVFVFENRNAEYLPPRFEVCQLVIEAIMRAAAQKVGAKYLEPSSEEELELKRDRINRLQKELFANETDTGDSMAYKEAVVVPEMPKKES